MSEPGAIDSKPPAPTDTTTTTSVAAKKTMDDEDTMNENSADVRLAAAAATAAKAGNDGGQEAGEIADNGVALAAAASTSVKAMAGSGDKVEEVETAGPFPFTTSGSDAATAAQVAAGDSVKKQDEAVALPKVVAKPAETVEETKKDAVMQVASAGALAAAIKDAEVGEMEEGEMETPEPKKKNEDEPARPRSTEGEDGELTEGAKEPGQEEKMGKGTLREDERVPVKETPKTEEAEDGALSKAKRVKSEDAEDAMLNPEARSSLEVEQTRMEGIWGEAIEKVEEGEDAKKAPKGVVAEKEEPTDMEVDEPTTDEAVSKPEKRGSDKKEEMANDETDEEGEVKEDTEEEGEVKESEGPEETDEEGAFKEAEAEETEEEGEIKDTTATDEDMDESQSEIGADAVAAAAVAASIKKTEATYSTRGRSASGTSTPVPPKDSKDSGSGTEQWELSVREALEDLGRSAKEGTTANGTGGVSFLEALGEEERRTRTRFLPAVDGIHTLRKNEIKGDVTLARSVRSNAGNVTTVSAFAAAAAAAAASSSKKSAKTKKGGEPEEMDVDDDASPPSEEDRASDVGVRTGNTATIELNPRDVLSVPSNAFVPPQEASQVSSETNGEKDDDAPIVSSSTSIKALLNNQSTVKSPRVVESVTAFNPPRPPESMGAKKKHRMLRWERRPADVEVDLSNYRKTVQRTREELHTAELELERIETLSAHLRRHFLGQIRCIDEECDQISDEMGTNQQKCVAAADLLTSRTRSRGTGKGSYVMRDVLGVLKARGAELKEKGLSLRSDFVASDGTASFNRMFPGLGGVGASGFIDWDQSTTVTPHRIASSWVLPGDVVTTPYGEGTVLKIYDYLPLNAKNPTGNAGRDNTVDAMDVDSPANVSSSPASAVKASGGAKAGASSKKKGPGAATDQMNTLVYARICVKLPFGVAYFSPSVVASKELPNTLSDSGLVKRWRHIAETAVAVSGRLDVEGMANVLCSAVPTKHDSEDDGSANGPVAMDKDEASGLGCNGGDQDPSKRRFLPFGSSLLPSGTGRGDALRDLDVIEMEKELQPALDSGSMVLGDRTNKGVPMNARIAEDQRQESYTLQARVLHLRNQLYRQRRIRTLNERTFQATRDRSTRVEALVAEMRADLKSLKTRLDEELTELGIDQDRAQAILKAYYSSQDRDDYDEEEETDADLSPNSKRRRGDSYDDGANGDNLLDGAHGEARSERWSAADDVDVEREGKRLKVSNQ